VWRRGARRSGVDQNYRVSRRNGTAWLLRCAFQTSGTDASLTSDYYTGLGAMITSWVRLILGNRYVATLCSHSRLFVSNVQPETDRKIGAATTTAGGSLKVTGAMPRSWTGGSGQDRIPQASRISRTSSPRGAITRRPAHPTPSRNSGEISCTPSVVLAPTPSTPRVAPTECLCVCVSVSQSSSLRSDAM